MKYVGYTLAVLAGIVALTLFLNGVGLLNYSIFAPAQTAIDNKVFHQSQQFNDGMVRDLENLRLMYLQAEPEQRAALKGTILHRFAGYPRDRMTPELLSFYDSLTNSN
jgi:hypothetical protein